LIKNRRDKRRTNTETIYQTQTTASIQTPGAPVCLFTTGREKGSSGALENLGGDFIVVSVLVETLTYNPR
jgi:hypothetical protein